jgi:flagellar biosynthesis chaperone FliJ
MMKTFRYELSNLQRVQAYQIDRLAAELAEIKEKIKCQEQALDNLDNRIQEQEERLTQLIHEQPLFWIEARELAASYLVELRAERTCQLRELERLNKAAEQLMASMIEARKARILLEKHRARCLDMHVRGEERSHGKLMDELVLRDQIKRRATLIRHKREV